MTMTQQEIIDTHARLGNIIFDLSVPEAERAIAETAFDEIADAAFQASLGVFREGTPKLARLTGKLFNGIKALGHPPNAELAAVIERLSRELADLHTIEGMRTTFETPEEFAEVSEDEVDVPSTGETATLPPPPQGLTRVVTFEPVNSRQFNDLSDEYINFFASMDYKSGQSKAQVEKFAAIAVNNKSRYVDVGEPLGIPWWFIAGLHLLESSYNFGRHLHNGDSLSARTHRVPANRPETGSPPFSWEESAKDALTVEKLDGLTDWTLARALYRWEAYNGFGYRSKGVPTPYLWSFSNVYTRGKYVGDGVFDKSAVSKQIGAAVLLKALIDMGEDDGVGTERVTEGEGDETASENVDTGSVVSGQVPNVDGQVSTNITFKDYFRQHAPDVTALEWHDFLVKGAKHFKNNDPAFGLNTDPPQEKWPNILPLARVLQKIQERVGDKLILLSVYRSPAYNAAIPKSATNSQHVQFRAADFQVAGGGSPAQWHAVAQQLRGEGLFSGGIGLYGTFVHVDVRGYNADW